MKVWQKKVVNRAIMDELRAENTRDSIGCAQDLERALMKVPERRLVGTSAYTRRVLPGLSGKRSAADVENAFKSLSKKGLVVLSKERSANHQFVTVVTKKKMEEIMTNDTSITAFFSLQLDIVDYRRIFSEEGAVWKA